MTYSQPTPAGYYRHPHTGRSTWWDGCKWHPEAMPGPVAQPIQRAQLPAVPPPKPNRRTSLVVGAVLAFLVLGLLGAALLPHYSPSWGRTYDEDPETALDLARGFADSICEVADVAETQDELSLALILVDESTDQDVFLTLEDYAAASGILIEWRCPGPIDTLAE